MKELKDIIRAYDQALVEGKQAALATVVHLNGSAYRRPGARMLVTDDGKLTGAISGGCLEGDALRKAQMVMVQKKPMLVTYDTTDEDDAQLGVGLGCNGIISILIEPVIASDTNNPIALLKGILSKRQASALVTLFSLEKKSVQHGTCMLVSENDEVQSSLSNTLLQQNLLLDAKAVLNQRTSLTKNYGSDSSVTGFIEMVEPAVSLIIFGAGNDAIPLVQIANVVGWETTVVDGRPNYATAQRFPSVTRLLVSKPVEAFERLVFDANTVAVLMTHNYNYDIAALKELLRYSLPYIGALGPKKKLARMFDELNEQGTFIYEKSKANVFGPTGLDVGAETADEIALSIVAEIKSVLSGRLGMSLRDKGETIHPRNEQEIIDVPINH